jgi:hypothetical protein
MTRLLVAVTALLGVARAFSSPPAAPARWAPPSHLLVVESAVAANTPSEIPHCCFGCWWGQSGGIRYIRDESETLLAMIPTGSKRR